MTDEERAIYDLTLRCLALQGNHHPEWAMLDKMLLARTENWTPLVFADGDDTVLVVAYDTDGSSAQVNACPILRVPSVRTTGKEE